MSSSNDFVIENGILKKYIGPGGDVVIPDGVTSIGIWAFLCCMNLISVTIPDSVKYIDFRTFRGCSSLTIHCKAGSCIERYAKYWNLPFVAE